MSIWTRIKTAIEGEKTSVEATLTAFEQKYLPQVLVLLHQIEQTIGQQGMTILEQAIGDVAIVVESGGNLGVAITSVVPTVVAQVKEDLKADAKNAAYGAAAIVIAARGTTPVTAPVVSK